MRIILTFFLLGTLLSRCKINPWNEFEQIKSVITFEHNYSKGRVFEVFELRDGRFVINNYIIAQGNPKLLILDSFGMVQDSMFLPDVYHELNRMILVDEKIVLGGRIRQFAGGSLNFDKALIVSYNLDFSLNQTEIIEDNFKFHHLKKINGLASDFSNTLYFFGEYSNDIYQSKSTFWGTTTLNTPLGWVRDSIIGELPNENSVLSGLSNGLCCVVGNKLCIINSGSVNVQYKKDLGNFGLIGGPIIHSSGKILMCGYGTSSVSSVQIRDLGGNLVTEKKFDDAIYTCIAETRDSGFVIAGIVNSLTTGKDIVLQKFNSKFIEDTTMHKIFTRGFDEIPLSIIQTSDKGFLIGGYQTINGSDFMYVLKTDSIGIVK